MDCIERMAQDYAIYVIYVDTAKYVVKYYCNIINCHYIYRLLEVAEDYILEPLPKYKVS